MITCRVYRDGALEQEGFDPALVSDFLEEEGTLVWLDLEDPTEDELSMIEEEFSLHPLAVEDTRHRNQRPKVDVYPDHFFLVIHALTHGEKEEEELRDQEIHAFVGRRYLVTLRYPPTFDLALVLKRWERQPELTKEGGGFLLYALIDEVMDSYFAVIERFEDLSEEIEEKVFSDEVAPDIQEQIFRLKKQVIHFRRLVIPLREVLDLLQEEVGVVTEPLRAYYRDVADHVIRVLEFVDNVRDLLTTALEAHLAQTSNRLNIVMKRLTGWASIILVPTLIAGIYGMNFRHMPELLWKYGYAWALGLMGVSGTVLYLMFKRRDWL